MAQRGREMDKMKGKFIRSRDCMERCGCNEERKKADIGRVKKSIREKGDGYSERKC